jgi:alkylglycerol monooxygenase
MILLFSPLNKYTLLTPLAIFFILLEIGLCFYYEKKLISFPEAIANFGTAL